jgi:WD40 repeat protein
VMWAEFVDADHLVTSSRGGKVVLWDFPSAKPICHFDLVIGAVPCLSGDRKTISFCNENRVGLFNVAERKITAMAPVSGKLQWPYTAFSPSGKRMACIAFSRILVWDVETGKLLQDFEPTGVHIHGAISFPDDNFILAGNKFLIDIENQIKLWEYSGAEQLLTAGNVSLVGLAPHNAAGALLALELPHPAARDMLSKVLKQPDLFVFRTGTTVKLDVSGVPAADQEHVREALTKTLTAMKCPVADTGTITLVAAVSGPKERKISYHNSGDYTVQEYLTELRFVYQGLPAWSMNSSNIPGMVWLKEGENIEGVLRKASEKPGISFYDGVVLPKFLQKPSAEQGANGRQSLGASQITMTGFK